MMMSPEDAEKLAGIILDKANFANEIDFRALLEALEEKFPEAPWRSMMVESETEGWLTAKYTVHDAGGES